MNKYLLFAFIILPLTLRSQAYIVPADTTVCYANNSGALRLMDASFPVKRWEISYTGNVPWISIAVQTNTMQFNNLTTTAWYRAILQNGISEIAVGPVKINVNPQALPGVVSGSNLVCRGNNSGVLTLSSYQGNVTLWQYSLDQVSWKDSVVSSPKDEFLYTNVDIKTYFRAVVQSGSGCMPVYSPVFTMDVSDVSDAGIISGGTTVCEGANSGTVRISGYTGSAIRWESSSTGYAPWNSIANTADSITFQNISNTTYYRAIVQSGVCPSVASNTAKIQVDALSNGGLAGNDAVVCSKTNNGSILLTGFNGNILQWQYSINNGTTWQDTAITSASIAYQSLTRSRLYRVEVKNGVCVSKYSGSARITVNPLPVVSFSAANTPQGETVLFTNTSTIASGSISKYYWDFNNGGFSILANPQYIFSNYGTYQVKLEATSDKGCVDSVRQSIEIFNVPKVDFTFSNVCLKNEASFLNTTISSETGLTYSWDFGDGSPVSSDENPVHKYSTAGQYNVTLTVSSANASSFKTKTIEIYPQASPMYVAGNVCIGNNTNFLNKSVINGGYLSYQWDFGDGNKSSELNPVHFYETAGTFYARLITSTNNNCLDTIDKTVIVHPRPKANFSTTDVPFGYPVIFTDSSVFEGQLHYNWDFGDGSSDTVSNPEHNYISSGNFFVTLKVETDSGCTDQISKTAWVYPKPHANFSFKPVCIYDSVIFENLSTVSFGTLTYKWAFGGEGNSTEKNPKWKFSTPGMHPVQLINISDHDGTDTVTKYVEIYPQPVADFNAGNICDGFPVVFENASSVSSGSLSSFLWDFGDGTNAVRQSPTRLYLNPDDYKVKLTVTSNYNCEASVVKTVTVFKNPVANFTVASVCFGTAVTPVNISQADINTNYIWQMGDTAEYNVVSPIHYYSVPGAWPIKLKAFTGEGCVDSVTRNVLIYELPKVDAGSDTTMALGFPVQLNGGGGTIFNWYPGEGLSSAYIRNPYASPVSTTTYYLTVEDEYGCINRDSVTISVRDDYRIIITNVVTPDGNGQNDTWKIHNIENYPEAEVVVFDRWGKIVLKTKNYQNNWQGRNSNNDILPDGTYYYVISIPGFSEKYKGSINILRNK